MRATIHISRIVRASNNRIGSATDIRTTNKITRPHPSGSSVEIVSRLGTHGTRVGSL